MFSDRYVVIFILILTFILLILRPSIPYPRLERFPRLRIPQLIKDRLRILKVKGKNRIKMDYWMAAVIGVVLLIILRGITFNEAKSGLVGDSEFRPSGIIILFFSMVFIAFALNTTGFFEYIALHALQEAKGDGKRLFNNFYLATSILTLFTSNDIVILVMTLIIYSAVKKSKISPTLYAPYLLGMFYAANITSMGLLTGNPTNIIAASKLQISFYEYFKWMIAPALLGGFVGWAVIYGIFFWRKPEDKFKFDTKNIKKPEFKRPLPAMAGGIILAGCLVLMSFAHKIKPELWQISLGGAGIYFIILGILSFYKKEYKKDLNQTFMNLPYGIIFFILSFLVIVEALEIHGWIDSLADFLTQKIGNNSFKSVFILGFGSIFAANLVNNIPMTVIFSYILTNPSFSVTGNAFKGGAFAVIAGSNLGANITPIGALAGMMWLKLFLREKDKKIEIRKLVWDFVKYGLLTTICVAFTVFFTIYLETKIF